MSKVLLQIIFGGEGDYTNDNINNNRFKTIAHIVKGLMGTTTGTDASGLCQVNYI